MNREIFFACIGLLLLSSCNTLVENQHSTIILRTTEKNAKGESVYKTKEIRKYLSPSNDIAQTLSPIPLPVLDAQSTAADEPSSSPASTPLNLNTYLELANEKNNLHLGLLLGGPFASDFLVGRVGLSVFKSDQEFYTGGDASLRLQVPHWEVSPFAGLGLYYGDIKTCTTASTSNVQDCEKKFLTAGYTELGATFSKLQLFWRNYNMTRAGISITMDQFWGIGFSFGL